MKLALLILLLCTPTLALAHESAADYAITQDAWTDDLGVLVPLYLSALLYLAGTRRVWRRAGCGRGVHRRQVVCFWSAWLVLALSFLSPLHWLSEHLFSAHMIEHELLMLVAAPLFVLARPMGAFLWAFPKTFRFALGRFSHGAIFSACWHSVTRPLVATLLHAAAIWGWHIPIAFSMALASEPVHSLQHLSFIVTALLFWWSLLRDQSQSSEGGAILWLFVTAMHSSALGILLTLARTPWVPFQTDMANDFGLSALEDQQLAGLMMWVPSGLIYTAVALMLAARWIERSSVNTLLNDTNSSLSCRQAPFNASEP